MLKKYEYSARANYISAVCGFSDTALVVGGFISALFAMWIVTAAAILTAILIWYFSKKYCSKIDGAALAEKIKTDKVFASEFFKENPKLKAWYCPKCRSVMIDRECPACGFKKKNKG